MRPLLQENNKIVRGYYLITSNFFFLIRSLGDFAFLIFCILFFLSGCINIKHKSLKSYKTSIVEFYINDSTTQYFVKPIMLKQKKSKTKVLIDLTYRLVNNKSDTITLGVTQVFNQLHLKREDHSNYLKSGSSIIYINDKTKYLNKSQNKIELRYIYKIQFSEFLKFINSKNAFMHLNGIQYHFGEVFKGKINF